MYGTSIHKEKTDALSVTYEARDLVVVRNKSRFGQFECLIVSSALLVFDLIV